MINFDYPEGATPLSPDEAKGLLLTHITTHAELNRWEQDNINEAITWLDQHKPKDILNKAFMLKLHKRMFGKVWNWAGHLRQKDKNIGVPFWQIEMDLKNLCDDVKAWIENESYFHDEMGVRFHHRLVSIHLFPNGNGRHARLMADLLIENVLRQPRFTWGGADLTNASNSRSRYLAALHAADRHDFGPLLEFARS